MPPRNTSNQQKNTRNNSGRNNNDVQFLDIKLTPELQQEAHKMVKKEFGGITLGLKSLCDNGYKVSVSWQETWSCYLVAVTGTANSLNPGLCQTSRSNVLDDVIVFAIFKALFLFDDGVWDTATEILQSFG